MQSSEFPKFGNNNPTSEIIWKKTATKFIFFTLKEIFIDTKIYFKILKMIDSDRPERNLSDETIKF